MRDKLQQYDFEVMYKKGSELIDADTLSRMYEEEENETKENKMITMYGITNQEKTKFGFSLLQKKEKTL